MSNTLLRSQTCGLRRRLMNQLSVVNNCYHAVQVYSGCCPGSAVTHLLGRSKTYLFRNLVEKFTAWRRRQQLDQSFQQGNAFYSDGERHEERMEDGFGSCPAKLAEVAVELAGLKEAQSSGRRQRNQSVCRLYGHSGSSSSSSSSGLLRLPPSPPNGAQTHL